MGRLLKYVVYLAIIAVIGVAGYALFMPLPAPTSEVILDVTDQARP